MVFSKCFNSHKKALNINRVDRLSAILIQLQSKKIVKASEIAGRFGISLRTVYRDIHALSESGVPVVGEAGYGYSLMEGYRLPPVMFTREEATTFLMAEKIMEMHADAKSAAVYKSATYKIKAVLRSAEKDFISAIDENVVVLKNSHLPKQEPDQVSMQTILTAINEKKVLVIDYKGAYDSSLKRRMVEPVGIFLQNSNWYLIGWCRLRNDYRNFKTGRMERLELTDEVFNVNHLSLSEYLDYTSRERQLQKVVLIIDKEVCKYIVTEKYYHGFVSETLMGDKVEMTFLTASFHGMARWFLMFGDHAEIIEPADFKEEILKSLHQIKNKLTETKSLLT